MHVQCNYVVTQLFMLVVTLSFTRLFTLRISVRIRIGLLKDAGSRADIVLHPAAVC